MAANEIVTTDYHTAGEPFRIVVDGAPAIPGDSVRDRRPRAQQSVDVHFVRSPRRNAAGGHADMCGCFLVPPDDDGADMGVLFWHKEAFSTACGHGPIALGGGGVETGRVAAAPDAVTD